MSEFSDEVLENAICCYQLRTDEPLDEVVLTCLCELKESRRRLQKIEEILEKGHKKCIKCDVNCDYFPIASEDYCEKLIRYDEIKRIVKGE